MSKMKRIVALVSVFLAFSFTKSGELLTHVEKTYYLKGKVGERNIAIKMLCYDESPIRYIYYFFEDAKMDHFLTGKLNGKLWTFTPEVPQGKNNVKPERSLTIEESKNDVWKGTWVDSTGKVWDLVLSPIIPDSISSKFSYLPFVIELDPYESYRLSTINFTKAKTEKLTPELWCDWYLEKESHLFFFRLRSANSRLKTDSINASLETLNLSLIQKYFAFKPEKTDTKVETDLLYLTDELVSFRILSTISFNTLKIPQPRESFTFDIQSGQQVNLEDIVWFDKSNTKPPPDDLYKIYKYRKSVFAPKIFTLLQELYPEKMKSDSCDLNKVETWALLSWNLTNKGIALSLFNHCNALDWAVIPFEKLTPFMEKKYHLRSTK